MACTLEDLTTSAPFYNSIKHIDEQSFIVAPSILQEIGQIFVRHAMDHTYAIEILHRHIWLRPNFVMLHSTSDEEDFCRPFCVTGADRSSIYSLSVSLAAGDVFRPFEYCRTPPTMETSPAFLEEVAWFFSSRNLRDRLALSYSRPTSPQIEYLLPHDSGTISIPTPTSQFVDSDGIVTAWHFSQQDGNIASIPHRKCVRLVGGRHQVQKD